jgi:vesicle transport through interaction with t-SNAREs 1
MDSSPASLFDSYEQDFQQILQSIRQRLEGDGSDQRGGMPDIAYLVRFTSPPPEQKKAVLRRVEMELDEADEMVCIYSPGPCIVDQSTHMALRSHKWR